MQDQAYPKDYTGFNQVHRNESQSTAFNSMNANNTWQDILEKCDDFLSYYNLNKSFVTDADPNIFHKCRIMFNIIKDMTNAQTLVIPADYVGNCETAATELYNGYVCGFFIILCIVSQCYL